MRSPRVPGYCLHRPTGQAYVTLPTRPKPTVVYLGRHGTEESTARYQAAIAEWLGGSPPPAERPQDAPRGATLAELVEAHVTHAEVYYRKRGAETTHVANVRTALDPLKLDEPAVAFTVKRLKAHREGLVASGLTRGGVNRRIRLIVRAFKWAAGEGLVPESTWRGLTVIEPLARDRTPAPDPDPVEPVDAAVVLACLPHMPPPVAAMVRLQLVTGMRPGEACSMRRRDIDATGPTWIYRPESHKAEHHGRTRVIPLGPKARAIVREWLTTALDAPLFSPRAWMASARPRAVRVYAERYDKDTYRQAVNRACLKAGVPRWHPNQVRHTFATALRSRFGLEAAQVLLGHARADVTQIYAERDLKAAVEIASKVG